MSHSDLATPETDEFTLEGDCADGVDRITQPLEPNSFALLKLVTKKKVKYFVGVNHEMEPNGCNIRFLYMQLTCWVFCFPEIEDSAVTNLIDSVSKLPHPAVSGSGHRIVTMIFGTN